jgi:hypothetical protein
MGPFGAVMNQQDWIGLEEHISSDKEARIQPLLP